MSDELDVKPLDSGMRLFVRRSLEEQQLLPRTEPRIRSIEIREDSIAWNKEVPDRLMLIGWDSARSGFVNLSSLSKETRRAVEADLRRCRRPYVPEFDPTVD